MSLKALVLLCAALVPLTLGCGSGGSSGADDGSTGSGKGVSSTCRFTLGGSMTGTYACFSDPTVMYDPASNITSVALTSGGDPKKRELNILVGHSYMGAPTATTYLGTDPNRFSWSVLVTENTTLKSWSAGSEALVGNTGGTYSITFTSLEPKAGPAGVNSYMVHGSVHAKALANADSGATGEVTVDGVF
jgi:hypothetical protein